MYFAAIYLFLILLVLSLTSVDVCTPINTHIRRIQEFDDKKITEPLLWTKHLPMAQCLEKCHLDSQCVSVNLSPETETCIGFERSFKDFVAQTEAVQGYQVFEKTLSSVCTSNEYCSTNFGGTHCYENRCRCDIGYSFNGTVCRDISECISFSTNYSVHPGYVKRGDDFKVFSGLTLAACGDNCINEATCTTADFDTSTGVCWLGSTNWFEGPDRNRDSDLNFQYIQRECNW